MKKWAVMAVVMIFILSGCGCAKKETAKKTVNNENQASQNAKMDNVLPYTFPLTGVGSKTNTDGRAVAVMINNHPLARPQSGLNKADIVYELLAEGGITRFLAVFQSEKPANIGPVRSARPYYIELAKGLNALYIAHGYSYQAKQMLGSGYIDNLNGMEYDGILFKRASFRKPPHNSYITYANILKGAELRHYSMTQTPQAFHFYTQEENAHITGNPAMSVKVSYSSDPMFQDTYRYDAKLGRYKRYSGGVQTVDYETKDPILLDNIFIIEAVHQTIDSYGLRKIDLTSGGNGYLLQKGKVSQVEWKNVNGEIVPFMNGNEVPFVQGKTWVNVVPTDPGLLKSVSFNVK